MDWSGVEAYAGIDGGAQARRSGGSCPMPPSGRRVMGTTICEKANPVPKDEQLGFFDYG
jgi:hypothetical protein